MKAIKYIYGLGLSAVLSGMLFTSCTDANDWGVDTSFDRLFGTKQSSFTVTEGAVYCVWGGWFYYPVALHHYRTSW